MRTDCALNIILIGMPGAGKSTVGVLLAKRLGYQFVDTDLLLQTRQHCRLQQIIADHGLEAFKQLEADVLCNLATTHSVVATGGSAVYSERAMARLKQLGQLVFIDIPLEELLDRVQDMDSRGLVIGPGETYQHLYAERQPLYKKYAEVTIAGGGLRVEAVAAAIEQSVCGRIDE
ncbi:MAG: shikimate kinase [Desulfuromonadales bacterium]|jgi:shikimate kinase|nr:shikimate kinase [Desulfuromonadales bacterium]